MANIETSDDSVGSAPPKKGGARGLVIGIVLAAVLGAGGFYAVYSGLIPGLGGTEANTAEMASAPPAALSPVAFVPLDPLVISLGRGSGNHHLRFRGELEVVPGAEADVLALTPRIMDVLNSYLRAVAVSDLEDPASLIMLRAQMLRRIQLVTGEGRVKDLLIMEFVLN